MKGSTEYMTDSFYINFLKHGYKIDQWYKYDDCDLYVVRMGSWPFNRGEVQVPECWYKRVTEVVIPECWYYARRIDEK